MNISSDSTPPLLQFYEVLDIKLERSRTRSTYFILENSLSCLNKLCMLDLKIWFKESAHLSSGEDQLQRQNAEYIEVLQRIKKKQLHFCTPIRETIMAFAGHVLRRSSGDCAFTLLDGWMDGKILQGRPRADVDWSVTMTQKVWQIGLYEKTKTAAENRLEWRALAQAR